jgi:uncharacterized protein (TIGR00270 family)
VKRIGECELCGSREASRRTKIDNAVLAVCDECVSFGQEIPRVELRQASKYMPEMDVGSAIRPDFHEAIKKERSKRNLTQEEFAKRLNEKSSLVKRIEEGWEPPTDTIRKIEKFLGIKLTEQTQEERINRKSQKENLTIGDVAEVH